MSDQPCKTPLLELARSVPKDLRAEWETQWFEDGTPCGHSMAPVGQYVHDLADEIERLLVVEKHLTDQWNECARARDKLQAVVDAAKDKRFSDEHIGRLYRAALEGGDEQKTEET